MPNQPESQTGRTLPSLHSGRPAWPPVDTLEEAAIQRPSGVNRSRYRRSGLAQDRRAARRRRPSGRGLAASVRSGRSAPPPTLRALCRLPIRAGATVRTTRRSRRPRTTQPWTPRPARTSPPTAVPPDASYVHPSPVAGESFQPSSPLPFSDWFTAQPCAGDLSEPLPGERSQSHPRAKRAGLPGESESGPRHRRSRTHRLPSRWCSNTVRVG